MGWGDTPQTVPDRNGAGWGCMGCAWLVGFGVGWAVVFSALEPGKFVGGAWSWALLGSR